MTPTRPESDAGYLEAASRIIFMGGLNRAVVDKKWPGFREVFHDFDPERVAAMDDAEIERAAADDRVIKYRAKLEAVVTDAREMMAVCADAGSFADWVEALVGERGVTGASKELAKRFAYVSEQGAKHWLYSTGFDIGEVSEKVRRKYAPFEE